MANHDKIEFNGGGGGGGRRPGSKAQLAAKADINRLEGGGKRSPGKVYGQQQQQGERGERGTGGNISELRIQVDGHQAELSTWGCFKFWHVILVLSILKK